MHPLTKLIQKQLKEAADSDKAVPMQAYMKTDQPFYGVQARARKKLLKTAVKDFKNISRDEYQKIIFELWSGEYREEMYQALEVACHYKKFRDETSWSIYGKLTRTATWWDTIDWIASQLIGLLVLEYRHLESHLIVWSEDESMWVRRTSLLAHLKHKEATNTKLLTDTILKLCHEEEFFIRKAIGWALRQYSHTNPEWVKTFVQQHEQKLSNLSKREALKHIQRQGL